MSGAASTSSASYQVFLSHAGNNKFTIAKPLVDKLRHAGVSVYFDYDSNTPGSTFDALKHVMETALVGVFVLCPEFVRRKVPMKELQTFVRRNRDKTEPVPTLIPIFYGLSLSECRDGSIVDRVAQDPTSEGFMGSSSTSKASDAKEALKHLSYVWGLENLEKACNGLHPVERNSRKSFIDRVSEELLKALVPTIGPIVKPEEVCQMAPAPEPNLYLNFEDPSTSEAQLLNAVLRSSQSSENSQVVSVGAESNRPPESIESDEAKKVRLLQGPGGVGKTQAVCYVAHMDEVRCHFPDGVLFKVLGEEARLETIQIGILAMLDQLEETKPMKRRGTLLTLEEVIQEAARLLKPLKCLIIFDDVWHVNDIPHDIMEKLARIVYESENRLVYTSRDKKLYGGEPIIFKERDEYVSKKIIERQSGLNLPTTENGKQELKVILDTCKGLPIALALAGKAVKYIVAKNREKPIENASGEEHTAAQNPETIVENAWGEYNRFRVHEDATTDMEKLLIKSVLVLEKNNPGNDFCELFSRLCVIRKTQNVPISVVQRTWGVSTHEETEKLAILFDRYSIVRLNTENLAKREALVGLHDLILDISKGEAKKKGTTQYCHYRLLASYRPPTVETKQQIV